MLFPHAHRIRNFSIGIALLLLFLQILSTSRTGALDGQVSNPGLRRSTSTTSDAFQYSDIDSGNGTGKGTLPYNVYADSPAKKYQNYVVKGCNLWSMLQRRTDAPGSQWTGANDMTNWGWESSAPAGELPLESNDERLAQILGNIKGPLADKGIGITGTDGNINIETLHTAEEKPVNYAPDVEYKYTAATFFDVYNVKQGAIFAYCNYGPAFEAARDPDWDNAALPGMSSWSDVIAAVWTLLTNPVERGLLRYIVRMNVINEDTTDVVSVALKKVGQTNGIPPKWPGLTFAPPASTELKEDAEMQKAFQAVLATPNVRGTAWLLLQHKWQLGAKTIKSITVWDMSGFANQDAGWELGIMVEVADYVPA